MGHDMRREWIIDVLADLKAFAEHNGMDATAAGLEDAALVAIAEISSLSEPRAVVEAETAPRNGRRDGAQDGRHDGGNVTELVFYRGQV